jgi:hypothetical protein
VIETDAGADNHPTFWDLGDEGGVDRHLAPRYDTVRLRESSNGKPADVALPADRPVNIGPGGPPLDLGVVAILGVGREKMETQGRFAPRMIASGR